MKNTMEWFLCHVHIPSCIKIYKNIFYGKSVSIYSEKTQRRFSQLKLFSPILKIKCGMNSFFFKCQRNFHDYRYFSSLTKVSVPVDTK